MITFYAATGQFKLCHTEMGAHPVVIINNKECMLTPQEMLVWSALIWKISTKDEVQACYAQRMKESGLQPTPTFDECLLRLESRKLIKKATNYIALDALYDLVCKLHIIPIEIDLPTTVIGALRLALFRGVPVQRVWKQLKHQKLTPDERLVMSVAKQTSLTTAEIIKCIERGRIDLDTDMKVLDALYDDDATTCDNIHLSSYHAKSKPGVVQAVSNLYLKKLINFDVILE